ncbi:MAG: helix-turn-helix domain-containing protein [Nannocystis sp.]|nr:helix-turn-helix domain-containing protein [Nannocystis sp.]
MDWALSSLTPRADAGTCRAIPELVARKLLALRREQPRRSIRTLIKALGRASDVLPGTLAPSTVRRLPVAHGLSKQPTQLPTREQQAFTAEHPGDLTMGDSMHGPR